MSDGEIMETESRISPERAEQDIKESTNESSSIEDFCSDQFNSTDHRQETDIYVEN